MKITLQFKTSSTSIKINKFRNIFNFKIYNKKLKIIDQIKNKKIIDKKRMIKKQRKLIKKIKLKRLFKCQKFSKFKKLKIFH